MYPGRYDNTNIATVRIPVKYLLVSNYKTIQTIDFDTLNNFLMLKSSTVICLKQQFGSRYEIVKGNTIELKKFWKIKYRIFKAKTELTKEIGLSNSYVSTVLKDKH